MCFGQTIRFQNLRKLNYRNIQTKKTAPKYYRWRMAVVPFRSIIYGKPLV